MGTECVQQRMMQLLKDPLFVRMRRLADERPPTWAEFAKLPKPSGITYEQAWQLLNAIRRQTAVLLPFADGAGRRGWYSSTRSLLAELDDIGRRCHEGSWLDLAIKSRNTTYFLIEAHVNDAITALGEDGLELGYEKAREVLLGERDPENDEERLLLNGHRAIWDLERYDHVPCTPALILEIYRNVSLGVGAQTSPSVVPHSDLWQKSELGSAEVLSLIANLVNRKGANSGEHPLILSMAVRYLFMSTLPLPAWNGMVSSLIMKLLFRKSQLPALAFVPIVRARQEWKNGIIRPPLVMSAMDASFTLIDDEVDYTVFVGVLTQLTRLKLDEVESELKRMMKRDAAFSRILSDDIEVNHRQRMVLRRALNNPEAIFKIESHRAAHRVAYATARADLLKLVELGFLECGQGKRAFRFTVTPGLRQLLSGHAQTR